MNKHKNSRSPNKPSSKALGKTEGSNGSSKSKSSSSSKNSSSSSGGSKSERNSRLSSSGSTSKKSKSRKDDKSPRKYFHSLRMFNTHNNLLLLALQVSFRFVYANVIKQTNKTLILTQSLSLSIYLSIHPSLISLSFIMLVLSLERKKSSSRHRSPASSRRSSSPIDAQKTSRKSSYNSKSKSSDSKHSKEKNCDSHSSSSSKSSPSNKVRNRSSRSKSPATVMKATDSIAKDIDLRAQLPQPLGLTNSLINSTIIDPGLLTSTVPTTSSVPISANAIADRKTNNNSDIRDKSKNFF